MSANTYVLAILAGLVATIGDSFLNMWAKNGGNHWLFAGCAGWVITARIYAQMLKQEPLGTTTIIFLVVNIAFVLLVSWLFFSEKLSFLQWLGIGCGALAVVLMQQGK